MLKRYAYVRQYAQSDCGAAAGNVRNDGPELVAAVTGRFTP